MKGAVLATLGKFEEAKKLHLQATKLEDDPDEAFFNLGLILRAELKLEEAKEAFENALELCPNEERVEKELEDVEKAMKLQKEIAAYHLAKTKIVRVPKTNRN